MGIATRDIAARLAAALAADPALAEATGVQPEVYLDAAPTAPECGVPLVVVAPLSASGLAKGDRRHEVAVAVCVDASAETGNAAASEATPQGYREFGAGGALMRLASLVEARIHATSAGAVLEELDAEFGLDSLPVQYAGFTAAYVEVAAFGG